LHDSYKYMNMHWLEVAAGATRSRTIERQAAAAALARQATGGA